MTRWRCTLGSRRASSALWLCAWVGFGARAQDLPADTQPATTASAPAAEAPVVGLDRAEPLPPELEGMKIVEKLNERLPLELEFVDQDGRQVHLVEYFDGKRPVILVLNYYRCPMLCGLVLNALTDALQALDWTAGEQFRILTVSFDPLETRELAYQKRQGYLTRYGRPAAAAGWEFLVGRHKPIQALLDATGFPARWDDRQKQYVHPAALILLTPDGRISRYLKGVYFEPQTLRLSLVEASEGKIGSTTDQILLFCFQYDHAEGRYALAALNLVRAGGVLTAIVVGSLLTFLWRRERRARRAASARPVPGNCATPNP